MVLIDLLTWFQIQIAEFWLTNHNQVFQKASCVSAFWFVDVSLCDFATYFPHSDTELSCIDSSAHVCTSLGVCASFSQNPHASVSTAPSPRFTTLNSTFTANQSC